MTQWKWLEGSQRKKQLKRFLQDQIHRKNRGNPLDLHLELKRKNSHKYPYPIPLKVRLKRRNLLKANRVLLSLKMTQTHFKCRE